MHSFIVLLNKNISPNLNRVFILGLFNDIVWFTLDQNDSNLQGTSSLLYFMIEIDVSVGQGLNQ